MEVLMKSLPSRPDINQLKRQAKELLADYRRSAPEALQRFHDGLPAAAGRDHDAILGLRLRLHDAQSCIAREYGFASWADLKTFLEISRIRESDSTALVTAFLRVVYSGDIAGGTSPARPNIAARLIKKNPDLFRQDPWVACATGDVDTVERQIEAHAAWVNQTGGALELTPLIAAAHSSLLTMPDYRDRLHQTVDLLLDAGADPNRTVTKRWSVSAEIAPEEWQVSALHGAAGVNFDSVLTRRLLAAGADPNDGESLYHSLDNPVCTPLLLEAGAVVEGTNALFRCLDFDDIDTLKLLLSHAAGTEDLKRGRLLLWAIRRRRSSSHIEALLEAGLDPNARTEDGVSAYVLALRYGLPEIASILEKEGVVEHLEDEERFMAACARGAAEEARRIKARRPDLPESLGEARLRMLPELAAAGCTEPAALMADLGWPVDIKGGDWSASALNQAVFRGDAALARHLLERGASWEERHGFGDNVCGTLSWASLNRPVENGDWVACAEALVQHGLPRAERDPEHAEFVRVGGRRCLFSEEVSAFLLGEEFDVSET
jgi:ankyrin repeat protein